MKNEEQRKIIDGVDSCWCFGCGTYKPISEFYHSSDRKTGFRWRCKKCSRIHTRLEEKGWVKIEDRLRVIDGVQNNWCTTCKAFKPINEFYVRPERPNGVTSGCIQCHNNIQKKPENIEKKKIRNKTIAYKTRRNLHQRENRKKDPATSMIRLAKARAKRQNLPFDLSKEDIHIPDICPVLGIPLVAQYVHNSDNSPSLDKIIPELGYVKGNICVISHRANRIKYNATISELEAIASYMKRFERNNATGKGKTNHNILEIKGIINRLNTKVEVDALVSINNRLNGMREFTIEPISQHRNSVG
jgi:hypothetical protein